MSQSYPKEWGSSDDVAEKIKHGYFEGATASERQEAQFFVSQIIKILSNAQEGMKSKFADDIRNQLPDNIRFDISSYIKHALAEESPPHSQGNLTDVEREHDVMMIELLKGKSVRLLRSSKEMDEGWNYISGSAKEKDGEMLYFFRKNNDKKGATLEQLQKWNVQLGESTYRENPVIDVEMATKKLVILGNENIQNFKENLYRTKTASGDSITAGSDRGFGYLKPINEDRIGIDESENFIAVVDGMGGSKDGEKAAQILAEELCMFPADAAHAVKNSEKRMQSIEKRAGAVFVSARILQESGKKMLEVRQAGDARLFVVDASDHVVFTTKDETETQLLLDAKLITEEQALSHPQRNVVSNSISAKGTGIVRKLPPIPLESGYRVFLLSDGIGDNLTNEEIASLAGTKIRAENAMRTIDEVTEKRMRQNKILKEGPRHKDGAFADGYRSRPKCDNRSIVIVDIA